MADLLNSDRSAIYVAELPLMKAGNLANIKDGKNTCPIIF